jgi:hypothetical protein
VAFEIVLDLGGKLAVTFGARLQRKLLGDFAAKKFQHFRAHKRGGGGGELLLSYRHSD